MHDNNLVCAFISLNLNAIGPHMQVHPKLENTISRDFYNRMRHDRTFGEVYLHGVTYFASIPTYLLP